MIQQIDIAADNKKCQFLRLTCPCPKYELEITYTGWLDMIVKGICDNSIYKRYSLPLTRDHKNIKNFFSKKPVVACLNFKWMSDS